MVTSADTSFLFSLYGNDVHTPRAVSFLKKRKTPLILTSLSEYELSNALRFAEFRKAIKPGEAEIFLTQFETDCTSGRIQIQISNLADVIREAKRLSATHTLKGGHRGFDILHVATALVLGVNEFLTFDGNQKRLAEAEGLKAPL